MIDLLLGALHPVREPADDVSGIVGIDLLDMGDPAPGLRRVAERQGRRPI